MRRKTVDYGNGPAMTRGMQILKPKTNMMKADNNNIAESSGELRSESEFNDRDSNPLDRMLMPANARGSHLNQH